MEVQLNSKPSASSTALAIPAAQQLAGGSLKLQANKDLGGRRRNYEKALDGTEINCQRESTKVWMVIRRTLANCYTYCSTTKQLFYRPFLIPTGRRNEITRVGRYGHAPCALSDDCYQIHFADNIVIFLGTSIVETHSSVNIGRSINIKNDLDNELNRSVRPASCLRAAERGHGLLGKALAAVLSGVRQSAAYIQCPGSEAITEEGRRAVLDSHNRFRSSLARGLERDQFGDSVPKASQMLKMIYDCYLEASAGKHAEMCTFEHSQTPNVGENLWATSDPNLDDVQAVTEASQTWWDELKNFGVATETVFDDEIFDKFYDIGHYTQMAWDTTYKLGCAVQHCYDMTLIICQYGPPGNIEYTPIYAVGEPCQTDADCPGWYTCSAEEGLCIVSE